MIDHGTGGPVGRGSSPWSKARGYLRLRPGTIPDAWGLWSAYARAAVHYAAHRPPDLNVGEFLRRDVRVRSGSIAMIVRSRSDDLFYALAAHKPCMVDWFHPSAGQFVVDIGAHTGFYSILAARSGADVVAVEPNPVTFAGLVANVQANRLQNITALNLAADEGEQQRTLHISQRVAGLSSFVPGWSDRYSRPGTEAVEVRSSTVDAMLAGSPTRPVDWLLIDTEGWEASVLTGAHRTLDRTRRVILEVEFGESERRCRQILDDHGFTVRSHGDENRVNAYWLAERSGSPG